MNKGVAFVLGFMIGLGGLMLAGCEVAPDNNVRADRFLNNCVEAASRRPDFAASVAECNRVANSIRRGGAV